METRSISPLEVVMMRCRFLILIAAAIVPMSLVLGPTVQAAVAQGTSTAAITPAFGPPGSLVTGTGANWQPGDHIQAQWGDDYSNLGSPVVVASDGTFKVTFNIPPNATTGTHQVLFRDEESRYFVVADCNVTKATIALSPNSGIIGSQFTVTGNGWCPSQTVSASLPYGSKAILYGPASWQADSNGHWQITITVGSPTPPATYKIYFAQQACTSLTLTGTFTVTSWALSSFCYRYGANQYTGTNFRNVAACGNSSSVGNYQGEISFTPPYSTKVIFNTIGFQCVEPDSVEYHLGAVRRGEGDLPLVVADRGGIAAGRDVSEVRSRVLVGPIPVAEAAEGPTGDGKRAGERQASARLLREIDLVGCGRRGRPDRNGYLPMAVGVSLPGSRTIKDGLRPVRQRGAHCLGGAPPVSGDGELGSYDTGIRAEGDRRFRDVEVRDHEVQAFFVPEEYLVSTSGGVGRNVECHLKGAVACNHNRAA